MANTRRVGRSRSQRGSAWLSTLILEAIAIMAILGAAQPVWFQRMLQRLNSQDTPVVAPSSTQQSGNFLHPMDAFRQPRLAPVQLPAATARIETNEG